MHFSQAVASIQSMVGSVKGVQILYSDKVITYILYFPSEKMTIHENDPSDWHQFTEEIKAVSNNPENRSRQSKTS